MTKKRNTHSYEVATALSVGRRDSQEDALAVDFPKGAELGYAVLADGMGGHAAGELASKLVVTEVFSDFKLQSGDPDRFERNIGSIMHAAVDAANTCVRDFTQELPRAAGMGSTLVASVLICERLYWISIGDSPLLLFRDGIVHRLNENHSMAEQIDNMARSGLMSEEERLNHPDRSSLSSGLVGGRINKIDCPDKPFCLRDGDVVLVASDGLQTLQPDEIATVLRANQPHGSAAMVEGLMRELEGIEDPHQDNVAVTVIQFRARAELIKEISKTPVVVETSAPKPKISATPTPHPAREEYSPHATRRDNRDVVTVPLGWPAPPSPEA